MSHINLSRYLERKKKITFDEVLSIDYYNFSNSNKRDVFDYSNCHNCGCSCRGCSCNACGIYSHRKEKK